MNLKKQPLISIITVCHNSENTIKKTIESIINQTYKNIEYIIIEGKSTDRTLEVINEYKDKISKITSEKDNGIYDAFNKGLKLYTGDVIGFVNSDDVLTPNAIEILVRYYNKYPKKDFFFGSVKKHWGVLHGFKPWKIFFSWGFYSSHSTGFYIKKEAATKVGFYNTKYKYSADYDYFYRMIVKYKLIGIGFSSKTKFFDHMTECTRIRLDNGQNKLMVLVTLIFKFIFNIKKL